MGFALSGILWPMASYAAASHASFASIFLQSLIILLREGFEALLIITAILTYLRRAEVTHKNSVVYLGIIAALLASGLTALFFSGLFRQVSSVHKDALEGIILLTASGVLLYVSYWLFSHGVRAQKKLTHRVQSAMSSGSVFALGLTAFLAVYREGAETILFYEAMYVSMQGSIWAYLAGILAATLCLLFLYFLMQRASFRIPYRVFFSITAIFLYYMAFRFIGDGIMELQEAGWILATPLANLPEIGLLSIYPTVESVTGQLLFLVPTGLGLWWWYKKHRTA